MVRVLVSACLLGDRVRYDGRDAACAHPVLARWSREGRLVPFCPEVAGGLAVPRAPAEIVGGGGDEAIAGSARVVTRAGQDVTTAYLRGASAALEAALDAGVELAVLKDASPSCGSHVIHDRSFSGARRAGRGVTTAMLEQHGIRVFNEDELDAAAAYLEALEARPARAPQPRDSSDSAGPHS